MGYMRLYYKSVDKIIVGRLVRVASRISALQKIKTGISRSVFKISTLISPYLNTQLRFWRTTGYFADLTHPHTFSEKISWLKLNRYADDPLVKQCSDKLRVRDYVQAKGLGELLIPLLGVFDRPRDINWEKLPDKFVLKWNFGCGFNLLCSDKNALDIPDAVRKLNKWGQTRYWLEFSELQYKTENRKILCEQFLEAASEKGLVDYKFYCFHGKAMAVLVIARPFEKEKEAMFMSPDWEPISDIPSRYNRSFLPDCPCSLEEMRRDADILSEPFPFVRVDFYEHNGKPCFGEMTFTPAAGIFPSEAPLDGKSMGEYINLEDWISLPKAKEQQ